MEARQVVKEVNSVRDLAISYEYEAALRLQEGKLAEAEAAIQECLHISLEEFPDGDMTSQGYRIWAEIDLRKADFIAAREHAMSALGVARRVGERIEIGAIERILGQCAAHQEDDDAARAHFSEALAILSDCGARYELAQTYLVAGQLELFERRIQLAYLHTALSLFGEMEVEGKASEAEDAIRRLTSPLRRATTVSEPTVSVLTRSRNMRTVIAGIDRVKNRDDIILLEGETGVGKDLLAKYIHQTSERAGRPFVLFNAAAVPEALAESELFGHVKGAFSGAVREREGLLFAAKDGTFFFNEISEAPPAFQAKLLSVIETRRVRPVGSNAERPIDARLIFATNRNLEAEVQAGSFRKDLFYRMASARFVIPSLRERACDVDLLLAEFLRNEGVATRDIEKLKGSEAWQECMQHRWDGNVRELEMFARRLARELDHASSGAVPLLHRLIAELKRSVASPKGSVEEDEIRLAVTRNGGNKRRAAAELGIPESTLRWKLKQLDIEAES
jgi:transcriptional regulator with PAS, ATPase and Fis domain